MIRCSKFARVQGFIELGSVYYLGGVCSSLSEEDHGLCGAFEQAACGKVLLVLPSRDP